MRPPLPREKRDTDEPVVAQGVENEHLDSGVPVGSNTTLNINTTNASYEEEQKDRDENCSPCVTVTHKPTRDKSHSFLNASWAHSQKAGDGRKGLTVEQTRAIKAATNNLTDEQKEMLWWRQDSLLLPQESLVSSNEEGPLKNKGKGIDHREWGKVNISQESLNLEA